MILAQTNPDPAIAWNVVLTIGVLANLAVALVALARGNRSQKREVIFGFTPASKEEFDRHVAANKHEHDQLFAKIGGVERGVTERLERKIDSFAKDGDVSREKLHRRVDRISIGVARLCGRMEVPIPEEQGE